MTNRLPLDILIIVKLILDQPVQTLILFFVCVCLFVCCFFFQGIARLQRHQQIVDEVKLALKPFYRQGKITKDDYKLVMKKSVEKVCEMFVLGDHLLKLKQNKLCPFLCVAVVMFTSRIFRKCSICSVSL